MEKAKYKNNQKIIKTEMRDGEHQIIENETGRFIIKP